jgi:murein DD-endopeptidase MepM/ murein hydrolase activator NlpD
VTEIRFQPGDAGAAPRVFRVNERSPIVRAVAVAGGFFLVLGALGTPSLVVLLARSVDRFEARATAGRGAEALASVARRRERLARRLSADELVLARLAVITSLRPPSGFPPDAPPRDGPPASAEADVSALARRVAADEALRRRLAAETGALDAALLPSRSPVEPSVAVPIAVFGPRVSPVTREKEFFAGLLLAVPAGSEVRAPAFGTLAFAGQAPASAGASWRGLGLVAVLAHGPSTWTVYGHLQSISARRGQRVARGEAFARAGRSGLAAAPALHYEVRRKEGARAVPVDPRLLILDADWLSPAEVRASAAPQVSDDLPEPLR